MRLGPLLADLSRPKKHGLEDKNEEGGQIVVEGNEDDTVDIVDHLQPELLGAPLDLGRFLLVLPILAQALLLEMSDLHI